ncbi:hypothetical protein [Nostoc sp. CALU 546]|uniref:hypothetical protein n=1 Tax=Nostoc sp. CALU 546 TaxID=1867241 RepID=UPI0026992870
MLYFSKSAIAYLGQKRSQFFKGITQKFDRSLIEWLIKQLPQEIDNWFPKDTS